MEFGQKIIREVDLFDLTNFLAWTFLYFLAHYDISESNSKNLERGHFNF